MLASAEFLTVIPALAQQSIKILLSISSSLARAKIRIFKRESFVGKYPTGAAGFFAVTWGSAESYPLPARPPEFSSSHTSSRPKHFANGSAIRIYVEGVAPRSFATIIDRLF
jgi:hypothetical protein